MNLHSANLCDVAGEKRHTTLRKHKANNSFKTSATQRATGAIFSGLISTAFFKLEKHDSTEKKLNLDLDEDISEIILSCNTIGRINHQIIQ